MKFKDMSKEEKLALCEAVIDGKRVEYFDRLRVEWKSKPVKDAFTVEFLDSFEYRIAPEKPSINWDHVAPEFKWLAVDTDGLASIFKEKPIFDDGVWTHSSWVEAAPFLSFKPSNCAPEDSLVERPEGST